MRMYRVKARTAPKEPPRRRIEGRLARQRLEIKGEAVSFIDADVSDVDFSGSRFSTVYVEGSRFEDCQFVGVRFAVDAEANLGIRRASIYRNCVFDRSDLRHVVPGQARFEACSFRGARISDFVSQAAEFIDCVFEGRIREAIFYGRPPDVPWRTEGWLHPMREVNEFRGNDFRQAQLEGCSFRAGIDLDQQALPDSGEYLRLDRRVDRFACARAVVATWPPGPQRQHAEVVIKVWGDPGLDQEELFVWRADLGSEEDSRALIEALMAC